MAINARAAFRLTDEPSLSPDHNTLGNSDLLSLAALHRVAGARELGIQPAPRPRTVGGHLPAKLLLVHLRRRRRPWRRSELRSPVRIRGLPRRSGARVLPLIVQARH